MLLKSTEGYIFGGYTEVAWDSSSGRKRCEKSFLFKLGQGEQVSPSVHRIRRNKKSGILCKAGKGPYFGKNPDMRVVLGGSTTTVQLNLGSCYPQAGTSGNFFHPADPALTEVEVFAL